MNKMIPSVIQDNGEYYIHMEEYKKTKELGEHYKHLYSEVKKQKDDVAKVLKELKYRILYEEDFRIDDYIDDDFIDDLLRMLGEKDNE